MALSYTIFDVSMGVIPVSVIVLTKNEAANIHGCIQRLAEFEEVVVVDSGSTDGTPDILARDFPDVRVYQHPFKDFGDQRNWAIDHTDVKSEWILFLDADEHCTAELSDEIYGVVTSDRGEVGYYLTCRNIFLNRWIKRCTMFPSWQLRLFRKSCVRYRKEGHGQREVTNGRLGYLKNPYNHYGFSQGIEHWIARHNRYSTDEVQLILRLRDEPLRLSDLFRTAIQRRRALKRIASRTGWMRPWFRFAFLYIGKLGVLDGRAGLIFCLLRLSHEIHIIAKLAETKHMRTGT